MKGPRLSSEELADALGRRLGGTVVGLRRLSGGASRVTSAFELEDAGDGRHPLILQMDRGAAPPGRVRMERDLLQAAGAAGVPVPGVVALGEGDELGASWLVVERLEGETIPRKILRDENWGRARTVLAAQCGRALAGIHRVGPDALDQLPGRDPLRDPSSVLDTLHVTRPVTELAVRWLRVHPIDERELTVVHGDFRLGNLLVDGDGLRGVLDWELAHRGDPREDIGWLCARTWRFGGSGRVAGVSELSEFRDAYVAEGGETFTDEDVTWWEIYAGTKWAAICAMQCAAHLSGASRSVELAMIGRRICETEWDLLTTLDATRPDALDEPPTRHESPAVLGHPTISELAEALLETWDARLQASGDVTRRYATRVERNALAIIDRELRLGGDVTSRHMQRLEELGFSDDHGLVGAIREGELDDDLDEVATVLASSIRDELLIANPDYPTR